MLVLFCLGFLLGAKHERSIELAPFSTNKSQELDVRGVWLTTLYGLDWPSISSLDAKNDVLRIRLQKKELVAKLDNLVRLGINTVFFQVKPDGNVLYHSAILPWSEVLTGIAGQDPGYDPLEFILEEAHKRGLKIHAWLNPYRVTLNTHLKTSLRLHVMLGVSPASVFSLHPDWIRIARSHYVLDPGLPDVRNWITNIVRELINNYQVDGIQFDDYFYDESKNSQLDDDATYHQYGQGFTEKADWRRSNTLCMVQQVYHVIKSLNANIKFGISPNGIWRNIADDPRGSATEGGGAAYDTAYADIRQWVKNGLIDYVAPQLYWPVKHKKVRYDVLAKWWSEVVRDTDTQLYIGIALYKIGNPTKSEPDWGLENGVLELRRELDFNDKLPEISGTILFREAYLTQPQTATAVDYLKYRWNP
ncbi:glycoside hydrolase family 10 protein [Candidatus Steffania adelgidicola]|uniref:glycoside hydrolase family 10 protein n=1 Tax=Candidatus Steffania adelgidicola TaxID=1076626 RepID=UPI001D032D22|nr:glycoside hydrolase family 10 protein [Candidatus Steffania adelgidicola]